MKTPSAPQTCGVVALLPDGHLYGQLSSNTPEHVVGESGTVRPPVHAFRSHEPPDSVPSAPQLCTPWTWKPASHVKSQLLPVPVVHGLEAVRSELAMAVLVVQGMATQSSAVPLQVPSVWHSRAVLTRPLSEGR